MIRILPLFFVVAAPAFAEVPLVATDIPPIHSLTAMVMGDLGTPALLLPPGTSPHDHAFRPSEARALSAAGLIIWVGPGLTPWLAGPIDALGADAARLILSDLPGWTPLPLRSDATFADHHDHDHSPAGMDPHAWMDPDIAIIWLGGIADTLGFLDPDNAATYRANADTAQADLEALKSGIIATLAPVRGRTFVTPHDAYQYFEVAFDMPATAAITLGDAAPPGPQQIADLKDRIAADGIACVLTDSQTNPDWVSLVTEGTATRTAPIDDIGIGLTPGPDLYQALLTAAATSLAVCLR